MAKELRKFLFKFPYLPRPRIIKERVEVPSWLITLLFFLSLFLPWCGRPSSPPFFSLMAEPHPSCGDPYGGRIKFREEEEEGEKESFVSSIPWSMVVVAEPLHPRRSFDGRNLQGRRRCLVVLISEDRCPHNVRG